MRKVLFVDDDPITLHLGEIMVRDLGCEVVGANCGKAALEQLEKSVFEVVFLDLMMPDIYGLDILRAIRAKKKLNGTHVVLQTGIKNLEDIELAYKLGATVMFKPYDRQMLADCLLELKNTSSGKG